MKTVAVAVVAVFGLVSIGAVADEGEVAPADNVVRGEQALPRASVALSAVPHRAASVDPDYRRLLDGEGEKSRPEIPVSEEEFQEMLLESLRQGVDPNVQVMTPGRNPSDTSPVTDRSFKSIGCNPGAGTVNCVRWYEIDVSGPAPNLVQQGTLASDGEYRSFPDLAVDRCGDMVAGYSKTSNAMYPGVFISGRENGDPAGVLKTETEVHAGEGVFTCYDGAPYRWGDYSGAVLDPDGTTMWYVGEYSRIGTFCKWGTWVHGAHWESCLDPGAAIFSDNFESGDDSALTSLQ